MQASLKAIPLLLALLSASLPAAAGPHGRARSDHEEARRAVERGEIKPLAVILEKVRAGLPGEIASIEIELKQGRWLYEFRTLDARGRLFEVYVDAQTAEIVQVKEK